MRTLEIVDKETWEEFCGSDCAVLLIGKTDCEACRIWGEELEAFLGEDAEHTDVRFGKLFINVPGLHKFKKASPWLAEVTDLPYTVIYRGGVVEKSFYGGGVDRLVKRLLKVRRAA